MLLYIIRHGDPIYNPDTLTEQGFKQAEALAPRFAQSGLDRIFSSPNGRARQTAQPTCDRLGLTYQIEDWMSEDYAWNDFSVEMANGYRHWAFHIQNTDVKTDPVIQAGGAWYDAAYLADTNAKEGYARIQMHSDAFLERLGYKRKGEIYQITAPNEERVAAFCHQGFGLTWLSYLLALPPHLMWSCFDMTHSGVTILEFRNNPDGYTAPCCLCLSDMSHIFHGGLPMRYNNQSEV